MAHCGSSLLLPCNVRLRLLLRLLVQLLADLLQVLRNSAHAEIHCRAVKAFLTNYILVACKDGLWIKEYYAQSRSDCLLHLACKVLECDVWGLPSADLMTESAELESGEPGLAATGTPCAALRVSCWNLDA